MSWLFDSTPTDHGTLISESKSIFLCSGQEFSWLKTVVCSSKGGLSGLTPGPPLLSEFTKPLSLKCWFSRSPKHTEGSRGIHAYAVSGVPWPLCWQCSSEYCPSFFGMGTLQYNTIQMVEVRFWKCWKNLVYWAAVVAMVKKVPSLPPSLPPE